MPDDFSTSEITSRARAVIPGGMYGHLSVGSLPDNYPQFVTRAKGATIWDHRGRPLVDLMCAFGANLLGYGDEAVEEAARAQAALGDTMSAPGVVMVDFCEGMTAAIDGMGWTMPCKNGTDATTMATTVARHATGRRKILVGRGTYHGAAPWCTPLPAGVLAEDRAHLVYYKDQDPESLEAALRAHRGDVAGVIATTFRHESFRDGTEPSRDFAARARAACDSAGALLILDEVRAGFRLTRGSSWSQFGVVPDLACYGKVLGNGYPISALVGAEGLRQAASQIYVTGSFWFSAVPMAAAVATLGQIRNSDYLEKIAANGERIRRTFAQQAERLGLPLVQSGPVQMPQVLFEDDDDLQLGFGFCRAAMKHGAWLHPSHNMFVSPALSEAEFAQLFDATDRAFADVAADRDNLAPAPQAVRARRRAARNNDTFQLEETRI